MQEGQRQSRKERKALRRLRKKEEREKAEREKRVKKLLRVGLPMLFIAAVVFGAGWYFIKKSSLSEDQLISTTGIHWHAEIAIYISGKVQEIPANIGFGVVEKPIHTHKADGVIHLEFPGLVAKDAVRLGRFFENWGKKFNRQCIFDKCKAADEKVKMFVNGKPNFEFENYIMKNNDKIEIIF